MLALSVFMYISILFLTNLGFSLSYLCDVDTKCELRSNQQLCQAKEKNCESFQSLQENINGFINSTGEEIGLRKIQGQLKLLTGIKDRSGCARLTTLSYSSNGYTNSTYKLVLQLQGYHSNFSISIYYPDFKQLQETASDINISNTWNEVVVVFLPKYEPFQLVLQGCVEDEGSYVAMDNIDLLQSFQDEDFITACSWHQFSCGDNSCISVDKLCDLRLDCADGRDENNKTCGSSPEGVRCTFDNGLCGWHNVHEGDNFDWEWHKGSTPTDHTGPRHDHTSGNGYYMYTEANRRGLTHCAMLESPIFDPSPLHPFEKCQVHFHYHMYGRYVSYLKLKIIHVDKDKLCKEEGPVLWSKKKSQGNKWLFDTVDLHNVTTHRFKLHFIAYVGYTSEGDIALDDISLSPACFDKVPGCGGILNSTTDKLTSLDLDKDGLYDRNLDCRWNIVVGENKIIILTVEGFDIEDHPTCDYDYLEIIDGLRLDDPPLGKLCGQNGSTVVKSTSNVLLVRFYTDDTVSGAGFNASFTLEDGDRSPVQNKTVYSFDSCGTHGQDGPSQFKCDSAYKSKSVKVEVISNGTMRGTQIWTVPENGTYRVSAAGARGGTGINAPIASGGGYVEGKFNFTEGEKLYIVVGQPGTDACSPSANNEIKVICEKGLPKNEEEYLKKSGWGGGGGGGATYVFKYDVEKGGYIPLIVAGGGGGQGYRSTNHQKSQRIVDTHNATGISGYTSPYGSGGGGGWNGTALYPQTGRSLLEGATGGTSCNGSFSVFTPGGFGGGGGACLSGAGGGGYIGGDARADDNPDVSGQDGVNYYHPTSRDNSVILDLYVHSEAFVEIRFLLNCPCDYWCNISDWDKSLFVCLCPKDQVLMADGYHCEVKTSTRGITKTSMCWEHLPTDLPLLGLQCDQDIRVTLQPAVVEEVVDMRYIIAVSVSVTVLFLTLTAIRICYVKRHKKKDSAKIVRLELNATPTHGYTIRTSSANGMLPSTILHSTRMVAEYNPNYDFVSTNYPEQKMNEINRDNLRLVRALGQGAFGEVYKGLLSGVPNIHGELPVAVKTLPALSTEQAELDFLMEAVIMSKFLHPNIVKFIGVCFDCHPRYIILELLEGGDLKTFLREMRPKPTSLKENLTPSLTCLDLLKIAIDIARGCQHLEEKHFIHRDIAARNCLLTCKGPNRKCKIADFGMTKDIYRSDYYKKGGKAMLPIKWMPPEAFLDGLFSTKTDVWSFGILLWEIFSMGYMPYPGRTNHDVMQFVTSGGRLEAPEQCPAIIYQLMSFCWAAIPETRPTFLELIERLERSKQIPEVLSAQIPTFYQIPKLPIISTENTIQQSHDLENNEDEEHCNQFIPDSQSKEPLLPCQTETTEHHDQQFISNYNVNFNSNNLGSVASENSISSQSHDESLWTNPSPILTDAITQCNVNLDDD